MNKELGAGMKLVNVNVLDAMRRIVDGHTKHYRTDFGYDVETLKKAAVKPGRADRAFLWLCREHGTWLLRERDVFIQGTMENSTFRHYAGQTAEAVLAYAVEATALDGNAVRGNIYGLDYKKHCGHVGAAAVPAGRIVLCYERGQRTIEPTAHFGTCPDEALGRFMGFGFVPESPGQLESVLMAERQRRERLREAVL